jgi:hypothetical protein
VKILDKTNVKVEFILLGDNFNPDDITNKLSIRPTSKWKKGEILKNGRVREYSGWEISTEYEESLDINDQLNQILIKIKDKRNEIFEISNNKDIECRFCVVVKIENGYTPAMTLNREVIQFAYEIGAEFEFDLYANPYTDED